MGDYRLYEESEKSTYLAPSCSLCGQHRHVRWEYQEAAGHETAERQETKGHKEPADHQKAKGPKGNAQKDTAQDKEHDGAGGWLPRDAGCSNEACADYRG